MKNQIGPKKPDELEITAQIYRPLEKTKVNLIHKLE